MNNKFMEIAIKQAEKAQKKGDISVGAVIVKNNKVIAKAYNQVEKKTNATLHAEIIAISKASKKLKNWRLNNCVMYVTLEPCMMCKNAIELCRISKVYYSVKSNNSININSDKYFDTKYRHEYSLKLIQSVFDKKRNS